MINRVMKNNCKILFTTIIVRIGVSAMKMEQIVDLRYDRSMDTCRDTKYHTAGFNLYGSQ